MKVRKAKIEDLDLLVKFTADEAREAENRDLVLSTLEIGIKMALEDNTLAIYWVLVDENDKPVGSISTYKEWSDWNAGFYWWIQSMYLSPEYRGKGLMTKLLNAVRTEVKENNGLEIRPYVEKNNKTAIRAYEKASFSHSDYKIMTCR